MTKGEQTRREAAVGQMHRLSQLRWQVQKDSWYQDTDCVFKTEVGRIYTGMAYSHAVGSEDALETFTAEIQDGVHILKEDYTYYNSTADKAFNVPPNTLVLGHIVGLDCSTAIASAWRLFSPRACFTRTSHIVPTEENCRKFALRKVGSYSLGSDYATSWDENFDQNSLIAGENADKRRYAYRSAVSNPDGSPDREKLAALYEAYAKCRPGDAIVFSCRGYVNQDGTERIAGHVRMVAELPTVVRDAAGEIDPEKSSLVTIEQGKGNLNKPNPHNQDAFSTWGVFVRYSFRDLAGIETAGAEKKYYALYVPVTSADFENPPEVQVSLTKASSPFDAIVCTNYGIVWTQLEIDGIRDRRFCAQQPWNVGFDGKTDLPFDGVDDSGYTCAAQIRAMTDLRWEACRQMFRSVRLKKHEKAFSDLAQAEHAFLLKVKLTTGDEKSFSGRFANKYAK